MTGEERNILLRAARFNDIMVDYYHELHRQWATGEKPAMVMGQVVFVLQTQSEVHMREVRQVAAAEFDRCDEALKRGERYQLPPPPLEPMLILNHLGATWRSLVGPAVMNKRERYVPMRLLTDELAEEALQL